MPSAVGAAPDWHRAYTRAMLEHSADVITIVDAEGTVLYESPSVERLVGHTVEERIGTSVFQTVHPDDLERVRAAFASRVGEPETPMTIRFRFRHADGSWKVMESTGRNRLDDPAVRGIVISSRDVTDRAESERMRQWQSVAMLTAMDGMAILDEHGRYLSVNRAHAAIYGYATPEELHGRSWTTLYTDIELRRLDAEVMPFLTAYGSWRGEATGRRRDGTTFPQELSLSLLPEGGIVCAVRDITESRRGEQELRASEQRFRTVVEALGEGIVINGLDQGVVYCNSRLAEMTGVPMGEMLGRNVTELCAPEDRAQLEEIRALRARGISSRYELRLSRPDGEVVWTEVNGSPFRDPDGRIVGTVAVLTDITDRRRAAEERERLVSVLNATLESTADALVATDAAGRVTNFNRRFAEMWGISDAQLAHPEADELVMGALHQLADPASFLSRMEELAARPEEESFDLLALKDGRAIERYSRPLRVEGAVAGRVWSFRDVTERNLEEMEIRAAKEAAEAANRAKSEFLSSMSHELRTPLNSVIGFAGVLMKNRGGGLGEHELKYLDRIHANGKHLLGLINDVLDLSKIEAGKMEVERSPLSLGELVSETLAELDGARRGTPVELRAELPDGPAVVVSDRVKLKQVLINLVGNALKFTERGTVTVALVEDGSTGRPARLEVRDTGVGIPPDRLTAIFGAFEQAESGITRRYGGTGLGLTISSSLCELMGYRLEVASEPGRGSTFAIVLGGGVDDVAAAEAHGAAAEPEGPSRRRKPGERLVLVIDDEPDARTLLTHHLKELDCATVTASSGLQGLRMARELRPDLITLDLLLPGMTGWDILRALKADPELCGIPVVIVSVIAGENRGSVLGAVDLIEKPIELDELRRVVNRNLSPGTGRILIVDDDPEGSERLTRSLLDEGFDTRAAASGTEALRLLLQSPADLLVLALPETEPEALALLERLRGSRVCRHVPVVVVTRRELSPATTRQLGRLARAVLPRDESLQALAETIRRAWGSVAPARTPGGASTREAA